MKEPERKFMFKNHGGLSRGTYPLHIHTECPGGDIKMIEESWRFINKGIVLMLGELIYELNYYEGFVIFHSPTQAGPATPPPCGYRPQKHENPTDPTF